MILLKDVHKSFLSRSVLNGVNLEIPIGKITIILGSSGEGKSVLLKHIIGLLLPDRGKVIVEGTDLSQLADRDLNNFRKQFGMLFQSTALFDSLTVEENVAFPLREHTKLSSSEIQKKVHEKLALVGLEIELNKKPAELSGGMRKRVGLARAIALEPRIVLYDEPTTGLDPLMTDAINRLILETQKNLRITSVIISHDIESTFELADFVAILHQGQICAEGSPAAVQKSTHPFVKEFLSKRRMA